MMKVVSSQLILAISALSLAMPAAAAVLPSLDRATFQAAAPSLTSQNFDSLANGAILTTVNGVTYSSSSGSPVVTNVYLTSTNPNGLGATGLGYFGAGDTATLTFGSAITAFGIDINTFANTNGSYNVMLNTGDQAFSIYESFGGANTGQFIGFVSDTPFTSVTLAGTGGFSYTLDTLLYGSKAAVTGAVPEPSTWAMMLLGFAGIGFAVRRRRSGAMLAQGA